MSVPGNVLLGRFAGRHYGHRIRIACGSAQQAAQLNQQRWVVGRRQARGPGASQGSCMYIYVRSYIFPSSEICDPCGCRCDRVVNDGVEIEMAFEAEGRERRPAETRQGQQDRSGMACSAGVGRVGPDSWGEETDKDVTLVRSWHQLKADTTPKEGKLTQSRPERDRSGEKSSDQAVWEVST